MSNIPTKVRDFLKRHNLTALEFEPGSTPTVKAAAQQIGVPDGQIAKSLLFKGKDGTFRLILAAGDVKIKSGLLKRVAGSKHRMATAEETQETTSFLPGGVCPFGLENPDLQIFIDTSLFAYDTVYPAAGTDATGVPISPELLEQITDAKRVTVTEINQDS